MWGFRLYVIRALQQRPTCLENASNYYYDFVRSITRNQTLKSLNMVLNFLMMITLYSFMVLNFLMMTTLYSFLILGEVIMESSLNFCKKKKKKTKKNTSFINWINEYNELWKINKLHNSCPKYNMKMKITRVLILHTI